MPSLSLSPRTRERMDRILKVMEHDCRAGGRRLDRAAFYLNRVLPPSLHAKRAQPQEERGGGLRRTTRKILTTAKQAAIGPWWDVEDEITRPIFVEDRDTPYPRPLPRATKRH